jgi:hypothetical protein
MGGAAYSYPIGVPPGIAGMQPALSLSYAGGGVNGPVGHGWSVQGISMITRCAATRRIDGAPRGVQFDSDDKLCLDGQRLIQTTVGGGLTVQPVRKTDGDRRVKTFAQAGDAAGVTSGYREYRTEKDSFSRIRAYGLTGSEVNNGPQYFRVWTKSGQVYEYGARVAPDAPANSSASVAAEGKSVIMVWAVARMSDVVGNYVDFKYQVGDVSWGSGAVAGVPRSGREWNISEIYYTGNVNAAQAPTSRVRFNYEDRTGDRAEAYQMDSKNVSTKRLTSVDTYINAPFTGSPGTPGASATRVTSVQLGYELSPTTNRSRLISIRTCATDTTCMPATTFTYSNAGSANFITHTGFAGGGMATTPLRYSLDSLTGGDMGYGVLTGDFNGDGRTDILRWSNDPNQNVLFLSNGDGTFTAAPAFNLQDVQLQKQDSPTSDINACFMSMVVDINGDGLPDILRWANPTTTGTGSCATDRPNDRKTMVLLNMGDGSFVKLPLADSAGNAILLDRVKAQSSGCFGPFVACFTGGKNFYVGDFDGDGMLDIVVTPSGTGGYLSGTGSNPSDWRCIDSCAAYVHWGNGDGTFTVGTAAGLGFLYKDPTSSSLSVELSDFNGDGVSDIAVRWETGGTAYQGHKSRQFLPLAATPPCSPSSFHQMADFNGDGRSDYLCVSPTAVAQNKVLISNGGVGFFQAAVMPAGATLMASLGDDLIASAAVPGATYLLQDFNGDGRTDILRIADNGVFNRLYLSNGDGSFTRSGVVSFDGTQQPLTNSGGNLDVIPGDFLGIGSVQLLRVRRYVFPLSTPDNANKLFVRLDTTLADLLVAVRSPTGLTTTLTHMPLASPSAATRYAADPRCFPSASTPVCPFIEVAPFMPAVVTLQAELGVGSAKDITEFAYRGLKASTAGGGLLGFRQTLRQSTAPSGEPLTTATDVLMDEPYVSAAAVSSTRRTSITQPYSGPEISRVENTYCDTGSSTPPSDIAVTPTAPCVSLSAVKRPYLYRSKEMGRELSRLGNAAGTELPTVTTTNTYDDWGNPLVVKVQTDGSVAGVVRRYEKTVSNEYCTPDTAGCPNRISGDNWIIGRLISSTVANRVDDLLPTLTASAGSNPRASATVGNMIGSAPALALVDCGTTSPAVSPNAATFFCTLSNAAGLGAATGITVTNNAGLSSVLSDASSCTAGKLNCGTVTVSTATNLSANAVRDFSGTLTVNSAQDIVQRAFALRVNTPAFFELACEAPVNSFEPVKATKRCTVSNTGETSATGIVFSAPALAGSGVLASAIAASPPTVCNPKSVCGVLILESYFKAGTYRGEIYIVANDGALANANFSFLGLPHLVVTMPLQFASLGAPGVAPGYVFTYSFKNNNTGAVQITGLGRDDASDTSVMTTIGTCQVGTLVPAGATCTIVVSAPRPVDICEAPYSVAAYIENAAGRTYGPTQLVNPLGPRRPGDICP